MSRSRQYQRDSSNEDAHLISFQGHRSGRNEMNQGPEARAMQDHSFGGRGDIANKEQGIGKSHGKSFSRGKKKAV